MAFKIGSFNLKNIGLSALEDGKHRDIEKIAEIIRKEEFDIVALQEVLSEGKAIYSDKYAEKTILWELGPDWDFRWADAEDKRNDRRHEGYAFVWNKRRMRLARTILDDGRERICEPHICRVKQGDVFRKPFYARFTPQGTYASLPVEIRLLCIHSVYGEDGEKDRELRRREIDAVLTEIYPQISDRVYKNALPSYTIVLGDYNAELYRPWHKDLDRSKTPMYIKDVVIAHRWDDMAVRTGQDQLTTLKRTNSNKEGDGGTAQDKMQRYNYNYDHFSYEDDDRYNEVIMSCKRVDAIRKYVGDDAEKYQREVSDHLPILLSIKLN